MRKIGAIFASLALALCLTACNSNGTSSGGNSALSPVESGSSETESSSKGDYSVSESKSEPVSSETVSPVESDSQNDKTLVVYFSASGNTKAAAELIAAKTNGDLFEIVPKEPYTSADLNWTDQDSRVCREHDDVSLRDIELETTSVPDWESYDTVFIGYPIWWQIAAWPVDGFVKANDFSDKTVIPFCTSSSSGIGSSGTLLEQSANGGKWLIGKRFSSYASESEVTDWIDGLEL